MRRPRALAVLLMLTSGSLLSAQGTKTRDLAQYAAQVQLSSVSIGADFWGHYIPVEGGTLQADSYLVVEVALLAPPSEKVEINSGQFVLKVNGERLLPQSPGLITIGSVVPEMRERKPRLTTDTGIGPVLISTGRDPVQPRFPGDTNPANTPLPPRSEGDDGQLQTPPVDLPKAVRDAALPEGVHATPISGYLYYLYRGKLKQIKHAEVQYAGPAGTVTLTLR